MPGTTFLPDAGPLGTTIGMSLGALIMIIIAANYHYMMHSYPDAGGAFSYTKETYSHDHGFLCAWFLSLTYIAIVWANVTAFALIIRNLFGKALQFGFHYTLAGYDIYLGEVLAELALLFAIVALCACARKLAGIVQVIMAVALTAGTLFCFFTVFKNADVSFTKLAPAFSTGKNRFMQIFSIVALTPWAFVGFESVSHSAGSFRFPLKRIFAIMSSAVVAGLLVYVLLTVIGASVQPEAGSNWVAYIASLGRRTGIAGMPVFFAVQKTGGTLGIAVLGVAVLGGIITGIIGNSIAASRLLYAMAGDGILPSRFKKCDKNGMPQNALLFIALISIPIPFLGRTATGWIVDVTTIGATIAYGFTSAAAYRKARTEHNLCIEVTGAIGIVTAAFFSLFLLVPNLWSMSALSAESYLILAFWSVMGFISFRIVFAYDKERRFGRSTVVWIALLFLIFFPSLMWMRQATHSETEKVVGNVSAYFSKQMELCGLRCEVAQDETMRLAEGVFLEEQMEKINITLLHNSIVQMILIVIALIIMFNIYSLISGREKKMAEEKAMAEEQNRSKTVFLSNMSHDIRTPMNAIIGYTNLARKPGVSAEEMQAFLTKIDSSSKHLLALINDVLEMSRIESGKMELEEEPCNLQNLMEGVRDMFATQMAGKNISYVVECRNLTEPHVFCDKNRLNRVLLNLISNAFKFTREEGTVSVLLSQKGAAQDGLAQYELRVKDNGIGMSPEFAARVFEAFERERTSTVSGIQGTGLGMAITKSIIDLMGGDISVKTKRDEGTEFTIELAFRVQEKAAALQTAPEPQTADKPAEEAAAPQGTENAAVPASAQKELDFSSMRLLLVDDMDVNREIATMILEDMGFAVDSAVNGKEAVEKVAAAEPDYYNAVLMDIQMPVMDGYEATRAIRALSDSKKAAVPIIAMTANAFSEDVKKSQEAGMNAHVVKPIDVEKLEETLRGLL